MSGGEPWQVDTTHLPPWRGRVWAACALALARILGARVSPASTPNPAAEDMAGMATAFDVLPYASRPRSLDTVRVERRSTAPHPEAWAITSGGRSCLNRDGEWEWEPMPSSRDDEYLSRTRWPDARAAITFARDHLARYPNGYKPMPPGG